MHGNHEKAVFSSPNAWNLHIRRLDKERKGNPVSTPVLYQARKKYTLYSKQGWNRQYPVSSR